jgi:hypothetical protein
LSALASGRRELIAFAGAVQCESAGGAVDLVLRGYERGMEPARSGLTEVLFSGTGTVTLPPALRDARVIELAAAPPSAVAAPGSARDIAPRRYRIESPELQLELPARSVQLHRDAAAAFFAALPPVRVPLRLRVGWLLLLTVLRIPKIELLLRKIRGLA